MRITNSIRPIRGLAIALASLAFIAAGSRAKAIAQDGPADARTKPAANRFAPGAEVVLKLPGLPLFDQGRVIPEEDDLAFTVENLESDRLLLVARDKKMHCIAYTDEVVPLLEAKAYFDRVALNDLRNSEVLWVLGRLCAYQRNDVAALVYLNRASRLNPGEARIYLSRSLVHFRRQKLREATDDCDRVLRLAPNLTQARLVRHQLQHATEHFEIAIACLEHAFQLDPTDPSPSRDAPALSSKEAEVPPGDAVLAPSGETNGAAPPDSRTAADLLKSGQSWYQKQEYDKAIADFGAALEIDPRYAPAYISRARVWLQKHSRERELADYEAAISLDPGNATYRVARAEYWSARGFHNRAMADFAEAIRLDPENPSILVSRGNEWRRDLKVDLAMADYTQAIQLNPKYTPAYIARANAWKQIRRFDRAIQEFSDLVRIDPGDPIPHQTLARVLSTAHEEQFRNGKWALDEATRACELTHWIDPDALDTLAAAFAETGDFQSAIRWQNVAIKLVRQGFPSALQKKAISMGGGRGAGVGFEDRLAFYKNKRPVRE